MFHLTSFNIAKKCRLCLAKREMTPLIANLEPEVRYIDFIRRCTNINISLNNRRPPNICWKCARKIKNFHEFILKCIESQHELETLLCPCSAKINCKRKARRIRVEKIKEAEIIDDKLEPITMDVQLEKPIDDTLEKPKMEQIDFLIRFHHELDVLKQELNTKESALKIDWIKKELNTESNINIYKLKKEIFQLKDSQNVSVQSIKLIDKMNKYMSVFAIYRYQHKKKRKELATAETQTSLNSKTTVVNSNTIPGNETNIENTFATVTLQNPLKEELDIVEHEIKLEIENILPTVDLQNFPNEEINFVNKKIKLENENILSTDELQNFSNKEINLVNKIKLENDNILPTVELQNSLTQDMDCVNEINSENDNILPTVELQNSPTQELRFVNNEIKLVNEIILPIVEHDHPQHQELRVKMQGLLKIKEHSEIKIPLIPIKENDSSQVTNEIIEDKNSEKHNSDPSNINTNKNVKKRLKTNKQSKNKAKSKKIIEQLNTSVDCEENDRIQS